MHSDFVDTWFIEMRSRAKSALVVLGSAAVLTACVVKHKPLELVDHGWRRDLDYFSEQVKQHDVLTRWALTAKIGVKTDKVQESATMVWEFADQSNNVRLFGPLGAGAIKVSFDQYAVHISDNKGLSHRGDSAEILLERITGWPIPVEALRYWLFSLPQPNIAAEFQLGDNAELVALKQLGWEISYSTYNRYPDVSKPMARKLNIKKMQNGVPVASLRLIAKRWAWK